MIEVFYSCVLKKVDGVISISLDMATTGDRSEEDRLGLEIGES